MRKVVYYPLLWRVIFFRIDARMEFFGIHQSLLLESGTTLSDYPKSFINKHGHIQSFISGESLAVPIGMNERLRCLLYWSGNKVSCSA